uniref:von Willebrand factor A domain-containing protein 1-like n=1 Tax=Doryrhamphus excisus TaxID=161450 RepID=UPI0025AEC155|nr:von Willebrand factor A domain-containing protein 1-like [Doryrhamphus excisus]XP_057911042.1 von Willebrand factor A domain-containing protein 1-like [Doryrhamphus excisus]XP_057911043.1 von Willebrand factor A domain-containing protein 1-like [Doryrhamphus excisus]
MLPSGRMRMKRIFVHVFVALLWATLLQRGGLQVVVLPDTVSNCCEGDILLLLDSSGSVANYEFSRLLRFTAKLLRPFLLGRGHVRVGLLQVGTNPNLEFGLDVHRKQESLQKALLGVSQLQGDTNTKAALGVAQRVLTDARAPKVLLWLTDGVELGEVDEPITLMKERGVFVLIVSTVHGNFQVLQRAVSPPVETHLYSVDIDNMDIITEDLRAAIIEIIQAERLRVAGVTSRSAVLQWRPVLSRHSGFYELWYHAKDDTQTEARRFLTGESSREELTDLQPETSYSAFLRPESNRRLFSTLTVSFTTLPDVLSPAVVSVSDSGPRQTRVSWGPLQPAQVQSYTVEYGTIPSGAVQRVTLPSHRNSTVLSGLEPGTQYLVTVSALYKDGKERALSVKACTQEAAAAPPALADLQLTPLEHEEVQAEWNARHQDVRGYWLNWERGGAISSAYLPPSSRSTRLAHLAPSSRVCVSPVYQWGRGEGVCCNTEKVHG